MGVCFYFDFGFLWVWGCLGEWGSSCGRGSFGEQRTETSDTAILYGDAGTEEERLAFLDKVFESGCRFWDTAEVR